MRDIPIVPLVLGLAGLIPFWALSIGLVMQGAFGFGMPELARELAIYGAIIISFLGGIRWGLAAASPVDQAAQYAVSILPSLVAWGLLALPEPWRLSGLGVVILALGPVDARLVKTGLCPAWLGRLRLVLSSGAGVALMLGALSLGVG